MRTKFSILAAVIVAAIGTVKADAQGMRGPMAPGMMQEGMHRPMGHGGTEGGMMCPMMRGGMMGSGMMGSGMMGSGSMGGGMTALFGSRVRPVMTLSVDDVRAYLTAQLQRLDNKRLKVGDIKSGDGTITADIVTVDNSLVQRMKVDPHSGAITYEN